MDNDGSNFGGGGQSCLLGHEQVPSSLGEHAPNQSAHHLQYASFTLQQRFLPFFYVKSSSNLKANDRFEICSS